MHDLQSAIIAAHSPKLSIEEAGNSRIGRIYPIFLQKFAIFGIDLE